MGYETRLIIGKRSTSLSRSGPDYFQIYAIVDMCKMGYEAEISKLKAHHKGKPKVYWYFDGDTQETEDSYGSKPRVIPIKRVIKALKKDVKNDNYRRFKWALALLESMQDDNEEIEVLFYGY